MSGAPATSLSPRAALVLTALTLLSVPLWLVGGRWLQEDASGWSELARRFPAEGRVLGGSLGRTVVALQHGDAPRHEFGRYRSHHDPIIEVGLSDDGFWLRSTEAAPAPPIFVPWTAVRHCGVLSATLAPEGAARPPVRLIVHDQHFADRCARAVAALDGVGR